MIWQLSFMAFKRTLNSIPLAPSSNYFNRLGSKSWPVFLYEKSSHIQERMPTGGVERREKERLRKREKHAIKLSILEGIQ